MNRKILELKRKRGSTLDEMKLITTEAKKANRTKTPEEVQKWERLKSEIETIDSELDAETYQELMDQGASEAAFRSGNFTATGFHGDREARELGKHNLSKAIGELASGRGLTGFEKEIQEEGEREYSRYGKSARGLVLPAKLMRSFTKATHGGHASEIVNGLDTIADKGLLERLGVTVYDNLTSQIKMIYGDGFKASFVDEGVAATQGAHNETTGKIEPRRIQAFRPFTNEYLAQSAVMPQMLQDMADSIDAAAVEELIKKILALPALAGFDAGTDAGAALTWQAVMKLKGALKSAQFMTPKFVAGGELFASLEATRKDAGSGRMIIEDNKISAYEAVDLQGLIQAIADTGADADTDSTHALIFGDWKRATIGWFGGLEILVDPYSASDEGRTKLTWSRLADVDINPSAFKAITNATV